MSVAKQIEAVRATLKAGVELVAVSKTHPVEAIREAYEVGQRCFGESRPQELKSKYEALPKDIRWHMIGHLQRNKVKYIVGKTALIHSVDSLALAEQIEKEAAKKEKNYEKECFMASLFSSRNGTSHDGSRFRGLLRK